MKAIEQRLPRDFDKSFIVFIERGKYFPCPRHYHPEYELVLVTKSKGRRMVGDHIGYFGEGDLVFVGAMVPHLWVNDTEYYNSQHEELAEAIVIQFEEIFIGEGFLEIPEMHPFKTFLNLSNRGMVIKGDARDKITSLMKEMVHMNGIQRLAGLFNIFDVDAESMTYDYEAMARDIETYGLFTYEELSQYADLSKEMFDAAGGQYLKVSIGKGNLTVEELVAMIERYGKFF